ncbi:Chemotaxis response regulator protein-glutamate methylesterase [bioreactor metagenome]|uniref:Chemotaxis response regulator protein-glutamate methylesterase n=1 Tax=bioreactor metagenome TaxID=1076179 RepID=A0A644TPX7_9ZZZZ|nr:response regulator [Negativicutes bacterium]
MMAEKIKVLIADDIEATRENIGKLMEFHPEITAIAEAATAEEAIEKAKSVRPDIILMDINMPGMDGITATELISAELPGSAIIIMSVQGEQEYLRRAMLAGAKNYLVKPFTGDELVQAIKQVYANEQKRRKVSVLPKPPMQGKIITVFSTKGGIGKTTIATNLAVALADQAGVKVGIVDADLQFGDVSLFLNLLPQATIADLVRDIDNLDPALIASYLTPYNDNVAVLPAPFRPEQADTISGSHLAAILKTMRTMFDYVIVDTAPMFNDAMLAILDASDQILVISSMDLPTIKNVKLCLEIMESLNYQSDKVKVVLNRADSVGGMEPTEAEESLHCTFTATLPSDGKTVVGSVNRGIPFVVSSPDTDVSQAVFSLAKTVTSGEWKKKQQPLGVVGKLKRLFG